VKYGVGPFRDNKHVSFDFRLIAGWYTVFKLFGLSMSFCDWLLHDFCLKMGTF